MSVTSGFFNSVNGDRRYNAEQMSAIFDGIINDGVLANIGTAFTVTYASGNSVEIGIGRAWFNSTWVYNDAILPLVLESSEAVLDRIDAIVIEIDRSDDVRKGDIKVVKGSPASSPSRPAMASTEYVHQYPLAYVYRKADSTSFSQADITSMIGTSSCPYVTGILQVQNIDNIVAQWQAQWIQWFANETSTTEGEADKIIEDWNQWYANQTTTSGTEISQWQTQMKADIEAWVEELQLILDDNTATLLSGKVAELESRFSTLAKDRCLYDTIEDANGETILDSNDRPIEGKTVFPFNSGSSDQTRVNGLVTYPTFEEHVHQNKEDISGIRDQLINHDNRINVADSKATTANSDLAAHIANKNNPHGITPAAIGAYEPGVGDILLKVNASPDANWALCNGATLTRSSYPALSAITPYSMAGPWTSNNVSFSGYRITQVGGICYGGGYYVAVFAIETTSSTNRRLAIAYSQNLNGTWTKKQITTMSVLNWTIKNIRYVNGNFVICGWYTDSGGDYRYPVIVYATTPSGTWTVKQVWDRSGTSTSNYVTDITYGNGKYVVTGTNGAPSVSSGYSYPCIAYAISLNGTWTDVYFNLTAYDGSHQFYNVIYVNGMFIAIGQYRISSSTYKVHIVYSANPTSSTSSWTIAYDNYEYTGPYKDLIYVNGKYYGIGVDSNDDTIIYEASALSGPWDSSSIMVNLEHYIGNNRVYDLTYINGYFVITVSNNQVLFAKTLDTVWYRAFSEQITGAGTPQVIYGNYGFAFVPTIVYNQTPTTTPILRVDPSKLMLPSISPSGNSYAYIKVK